MYKLSEKLPPPNKNYVISRETAVIATHKPRVIRRCGLCEVFFPVT